MKRTVPTHDVTVTLPDGDFHVFVVVQRKDDHRAHDAAIEEAKRIIQAAPIAARKFGEQHTERPCGCVTYNDAPCNTHERNQ